MGRVVVWTSITVLFFSLFQAAILANLAFLPALPDLVLLVIVYVSFMNESKTGSTVGFISGLLLDFLSAAPIGLNAFTKALTGFVAGRFSGSFNLDKILIPAIMGVAVTLFKAIVTAILSLFFGAGIITYNLFAPALWLEVLMNAICAPMIFALLGLFPSIFIARARNNA
jgi:rod shape-determining protein MreD